MASFFDLFRRGNIQGDNVQGNIVEGVENISDKASNRDIIVDITYYDGEIMFTFKAKYLDDWANIFKLKKTGASISPLSPKNLPKSDYKIKQSDENNYNKLFDGCDKVQKMQVAKRATANVTNKFTKKQRVVHETKTVHTLYR